MKNNNLKINNMLKTELDLNRTVNSLTVAELVSIIFDNKPIDLKVAESKEKRPPIKGIHSLAKYLGVCPATAQALKNKGSFPYFQDGRVLLFDPNEIDKAMQTKKSK